MLFEPSLQPGAADALPKAAQVAEALGYALRGRSGGEMKAFIPQVTPAARTSWRSYAL